MRKAISIINQDVLKKLLTLSKQISDGQTQYEETLGVRIPLVEEVGSNLQEIILDYLGIPPDTSICYIGDGVTNKQYDSADLECQKCTGCFCRDFLSEYIFKYENREISLEEAVEKLVNWEKYEDNI